MAWLTSLQLFMLLQKSSLCQQTGSRSLVLLAVIPSIEMAAAGLDSIGAIVGYAVCSGISITSGSLVYSILSGPLQVVDPPSALLHLLAAAMKHNMASAAQPSLLPQCHLAEQ